MLKILGWTALVLTIGVGVLVAYAATRPDHFRVARSLTVPAPPDKVIALIADLHGFNRWNPYERKDPGKGTYSGADRGVGSTYAWDSTKVGKGAMTITAAGADTVVMRLDFEKPFAARNTATFIVTPRDGGSHVTWEMEGPAPLVTRVMDVVIGMDRMVGGDFETGLQNLAEIFRQP